MSSFSEYQVNHYIHLFDKYSESHHGQLSARDLLHLMTLFGPELSVAQVRDLIYRYDYSCKGTLDVEDFLELLSDYKSMYEDEKEQARSALAQLEQALGTDGIRREDFLKMLKADGGDPLPDSEVNQILADFFGQREVVSSRKDLFNDDRYAWVMDEPPQHYLSEPLTREIVLRVFHATDCSAYARGKLRVGRGIDYETFDPMVSVRCSNSSQDTTVLIGHVKPEWGQELKLSVKFPSTDMFESTMWLKSQRLIFNLNDYQIGGVVPHMEWLAGASIPLFTILRERGSSVTHVVTLKAPSLSKPESPEVFLEVAVRLSTASASLGIPNDFFQMREEMFHARYRVKMKQDLTSGLCINRSSSLNLAKLRSPSFTGDKFWSEYLAFYRKTKQKFRRRHFQIVGLDEYNVFRCMVCFVTPLSCSPSTFTPEQIATNVARIPGPNRAMFVDKDIEPESMQCCSPSTILYQRHGSAFEHAVLLCDLFLGKGMDAYICLGHGVGGERHCWVIVLGDTSLFPARRASPDNMHFLVTDTDGRSREETQAITLSPSAPRKEASLEGTSTGAPTAATTTTSSSLSNAAGSLRMRRARSKSTSHIDTRPFVHSFVDIGKVANMRGLLFGETGLQPCSPGMQSPMSPSVGSSMTARMMDNATVRRKMLRWFGQSHNMCRLIRREEVMAEFEKERFHWTPLKERHEEAQARREVSLRAVYWDPMTGRKYTDVHQEGFPYLRVGCVFNNENIWINFQQSDLIPRIQWNLSDSDQWERFLTPTMIAKYGPIECWYSAPSMLDEVPRPLPTPHDAAFSHPMHSLCTAIAESIRAYRKNHLFIPNTLFHRGTSRYLQSIVHKCEESLHTADRSLIARALDRIQAELAPPHMLWHGRPLNFTTAKVDVIMQQLAWTGILDCSVPGTVYAFGAQVFQYPWGITSVWVYIGYFSDLHQVVT